MLSKTFEIRDHATFIVVLATRLDAQPAVALAEALHGAFLAVGTVEEYKRVDKLLSKSAWHTHGNFVIMTHLGNLRTDYQPEQWGSNTLSVAHRYIIDNWHELRNGQVIDCRVIRGEATEPAPSDV